MLKINEKIELGQCFDVGTNIVVDDDFSVYVLDICSSYLFPIGHIPLEERSYFGNIISVDKVVYLGNFVFSYKRSWSPLDEFNTFDDFIKDSKLIEFLNCGLNLKK